MDLRITSGKDKDMDYSASSILSKLLFHLENQINSQEICIIEKMAILLSGKAAEVYSGIFP